jgi:hypothetical protein
MLDPLLLIRTNEDRESGKHIVFVEPKRLRGPPLSHDRQVACPPRAGPYHVTYSIYALIRLWWLIYSYRWDGLDPLQCQIVMMGTEIVPETSVIFNRHVYVCIFL